MSALFIAIILLCAGAAVSMLPSHHEKRLWINAVIVMLACAGGFIWSVRALLRHDIFSCQYHWSLPNGSLSFHVDALSQFFLMAIFLIAFFVALYSVGYFRALHEKGKSILFSFFFNMLIASMIVVVTAANGLLFLIAWEIMSLSAYFLVVFDDEKKGVRQAGYIYLVATHIGTVFLMVMFWILAAHSGGSLDFSQFSNVRHAALAVQGLIAFLAIVGFGTKAGLIPFHVWLPEAHPAAPSPVSALMSGIMIKTGIYGLLRIFAFVNAPALWLAYTLIILGLLSGVAGVILALVQHDLKRLLAYHSVENIGIILLGMGMAFLGMHLHSSLMMILGFSGAVLHVLNHALFKSLLFMGAGSVLQQTGTAEIDKMGGLLKKMPWSGSTFLIAAAAICGLPPLNGFVSEFLIYLSAYHGIILSSATGKASCLSVIIGLALIGALAVSCFTKVFGVVFLGQARSKQCLQTKESPHSMYFPMIALTVFIAGIGLAPRFLFPILWPVVAGLTELPAGEIDMALMIAQKPLQILTITGLCFLAFFVILIWMRRQLLRGKEVVSSETWGCGYPYPNPRMQVTGSSFARPFMDAARLFLQPLMRVRRPRGYFPVTAHFESHVTEPLNRIIHFMFDWVKRPLAVLQTLQHGRLPVYVLYIAGTLLSLLLWYGSQR